MCPKRRSVIINVSAVLVILLLVLAGNGHQFNALWALALGWALMFAGWVLSHPRRALSVYSDGKNDRRSS